MIDLNCHCGAIKIEVPATTETVTSCNCSICRRYASLWAYFSPEVVNITAKLGSVGSYSWGDKMIDFHHCRNCGCITHYTSAPSSTKSKVAVNFRLLEAKMLGELKVRYFDGADTWTEIKS